MSTSDASAKGKILKRANPSTIQDKFLVGYQGWFTCGGDGEPVGPGHHGWLHWFDAPIPYGGRPNLDIWPDVSSYSPSELFPAPGLKTASGEQVFLFSSRHPKTVERHFHWMAEHGVDGAFLQRFAGQCESGNEGIMRIRDEVGDRVREAAEKEGRVFAIMYDVSGVAPERIQLIIERDWIHLIHKKGILDSQNYLRESGKPVVALWGLGFDNRGHTPALVRAITNYLRTVTPGGVYIMAGTPAHWRTAESDADRNPGFLDVWLTEFDAISPWTVGRFTDEQGADHFAETRMKGDVELIKKRNTEGARRKIDYIPVVLPGGSGFNLSQGKWGFNDIKRKGGRFLWKQIFNAKHLGVRTIYGAMWDEYDEGTAFLPVVENKRMLPVSDKFPFMALDVDGYDLPSDWYMRICGFAAEGLRGERRIHETFPVKELQDYWASRPKYEDVKPKLHDATSGLSGASGSGVDGQSYQEWLATQKEANEEAPPPPYSLEAEEVPVDRPQPSSSRPGTSPPVQSLVSETLNVTGSSYSPGITRFEGAQPAGVTVHSTPQVPGSNSPPSVNMSSRPQQPHTTSPAVVVTTSHSLQSSPHHPALSQDPISSLDSGFGKIAITTQAQEPFKNSSLPPPLHPVHPTSSGRLYGKRPQTAQASFSSRPGSAPPPQSQTRPGSQSGVVHQAPSPTNGGFSPGQGSQRPQQLPDGVSTSNSWGPAPQHQGQPTGQSTYPGQYSGAQLSRPHTFSAASSSHSSPSLRPHGPVSGPASYRPSTTGQSYGPSSTAPYMPGALPFPGAGLSSDTSDTLPNPAGPLFPSAHLYSSAGSSSYPESNGSLPPPVQASYTTGQDNLSPTLHGSSGPPHTPNPTSSAPSFPSGSYLPGQSTPQMFPPGQGPTYSGQPYGGPVPSASPYPPVSHGNPQEGYFPNAGSSQGEAFYFPQAHTSLFPSPQGYQQSHPDFPSYDNKQSTPYSPASSPGWVPGSSNNPVPPPMPPRPSTTTPYTSSSSAKPSFPSASISSRPLGLALSAVDKVAGRKTRQQLESGVAAGTKLFSKLTK